MPTRSVPSTGREKLQRGRPQGSVAEVEAALTSLCRAYGHDSADSVIARGQQLLAATETALDQPAERTDRHRLLVVSGWVLALLGCANFDAGRRRNAESCRDAVRGIAEEAEHDELAGWAWEMLAWFALADHRYGAALAAAQAGQTVAEAGAPVVARLALHEAKAAARLGDRRACMAAIDHAWQVVDRLPQPHDTDHHFGMDEIRVHAHAATAYLWLREYSLAEDLAWHVLTRVLTPDGHTRHPMRVAETRITIGALAARRGDLEQAVYHGTAALDTSRVSAPTLLARAHDLDSALTSAGAAAKRQLHEFRQKVAELQRMVDSNRYSSRC